MTLDLWIIAALFLLGAFLGFAFTYLWSKTKLAKETKALQIEVATLEREREIQQEEKAKEKDWVETSKQQMREAFESLAGETLRTNSRDFLRYSRQELDAMLGKVRGDWKTQQVEIEKVVDPLKKNLDQLDGHVRTLEQKREGAYRALEQQLEGLGKTQVDLQKNTNDLVKALRSSNTRGQWGEMQLKRVVEMAGMVKNVSFKEQVDLGGGRPDMIVYLPGGGNLPVDSKTPIDAYMKAVEEEDEGRRNDLMKRHELSIRRRIKELADRKYWELLDHSPEFVIMFVPNEACLSAAFQMAPGLLEDALNQKVLIATPVTLLALLKSIAFGWQQHQVTENARQIADQGAELYKRLAKMLGHLENHRKHLHASVDSYNSVIGSMERRVIPSARKFEEMGVGKAQPLQGPKSVELFPTVPRHLPKDDKADSENQLPGLLGSK